MLGAGVAGAMARKGMQRQAIKREVDIATRIGHMLASDNLNAVEMARKAVAKHPHIRDYFLNFNLPASSRGAVAAIPPPAAVGNVGRAEDQPNVPRPRGQ
jgi:hypothetical protein